MAACWRCGRKTPPGANFCPGCGTEVRSEIGELDVFAEPSAAATPTEPVDTTPSRWLLVGALALIGGLVAFFAFVGGDDEPSADPFDERSDFDAIDDPTLEDGTEAEPVTETEPTTSLAPVRPSIDGELDAQLVELVGKGMPLAVVPIGDSVFVYASDSFTMFTAGPGAVAYERTPSGDWVELGFMIDQAALVGGVAPTAGGAVAAGRDVDGAPTLWRTSDGRTWTPEALPEFDSPEFEGWVPNFVAEVDNLTVVGSAPPDPWAPLIEVMTERFGDDLVGASPEIDDDEVTVRGPFGVILGSFEFTDAGLVMSDFERFFSGRPTPLWESTGDGWTMRLVDGVVVGLLATSDGRIVQTIGGEVGPTSSIWDGDSWTEYAELSDAWQLAPWGARLVGERGDGDLVVFGPDLMVEEEIFLPSAGTGYTAGYAASDRGLVAVQGLWDSPSAASRDERVVILRDGFTLTAEFGNLTLSRDDAEILRSGNFWGPDDDAAGYRVDRSDDQTTIVFLDENGGDLVGFTLEELAALETTTDGRGPVGPTLRVLFSADGQRWYATDSDEDAVPSATVSRLHVGNDEAVLAALVDPGRGWAPGTPLTFRLLEVDLPE